MKEKFKWFIASLMVMVCLQAFAEIPEGKYYLYNTVSKVFLSRSHNSANVDQFDIPVEVKKGTNGYSLMFLDNGRYVSQSGTSIKVTVLPSPVTRTASPRVHLTVRPSKIR